MLVKSVSPKSCGLSHERRDWRIFPSPSVQCSNWGGGHRWCRHLSFLRGISPRGVGSLVVRASDSRPEGLGLMPPNSRRVHTEYVLVTSLGTKVLWAESRVQGIGEYFPPLQFHG
ncbi:uncharacterized protein TNCV_832981 [Trichonephila clavipes]|uniref:Uncharacterized protein n=1 Tax=Trichonephila clavipes TaxID=2585209 RepID=A0A8X6UYV9_TRICX|nr:uncharacterized protein TNCV_832981 [Trichonephila clavipes]